MPPPLAQHDLHSSAIPVGFALHTLQVDCANIRANKNFQIHLNFFPRFGIYRMNKEGLNDWVAQILFSKQQTNRGLLK